MTTFPADLNLTLLKVHSRAMAIQKEVSSQFPDTTVPEKPASHSEHKQLLSLIDRLTGDAPLEYTTCLNAMLATSPVPHDVAMELTRMARMLWCMSKDDDADCMMRLASGEARQLAGELRQMARLQDAHTVEKLALDEGHSVAWKLQLELSMHRNPNLAELSKRIEGLVTHAVVSHNNKQAAWLAELIAEDADKVPNPETESDPGKRMKMQQQMKTTVSGRVLTLERVSSKDPWRVREVDGVAAELICGALQEVYPQLSFADAMQHLEDFDFDFEAAAQALLHSPPPASTNKTPSSTSVPGPAPPVSSFPSDFNEILALFSYVVLLLISFYTAHLFDTKDNTSTPPVL